MLLGSNTPTLPSPRPLVFQTLNPRQSPQPLPPGSLRHALRGIPQLFHDSHFLGKGELRQRLAALAFLGEELLGERGHGGVRYFASNRLHASAN